MRHITLAAILLLVVLSAFGQVRSRTAQNDVDVAAAVAPEWPNQKVVNGEVTVHETVTLDGHFGNVIDARSIEPKSTFSDAAERAARLWKFFPSKANTRLTLIFVFEVFRKGDITRSGRNVRAETTFLPPYKVIVAREED